MIPPSPDSPYQGYAYSYPHKTAYRSLDPSVPLADVWPDEPGQSLFLYLHVPFCSRRCRYCNLFSCARPDPQLMPAYVDSLERQARVMRDVLGEFQVAAMALGGGTPTYLLPGDLERLLDVARNVMGADPSRVPTSVETSPASASTGSIQLLADAGIRRVSIGIQSFVPDEVATLGRDQTPEQVASALGLIRRAGFPVLNIDLIYGIPGQTLSSWRESLDAALQYTPEELYLYPLYTRPLTGLAGVDQQRVAAHEDPRLRMYRAGRQHLLDAGYRQVSMRRFCSPGWQHAPVRYSCQQDGMVGLGCSTRSYTRQLHYSSGYAVGQRPIRDLLHRYIQSDDEQFMFATHGIRLDPDDQRRRHIIKSVLLADGLSLDEYQQLHGRHAIDDLPGLSDLEARGWLTRQDSRLKMTAAGLEHADVIGPLLYSPRVRALMDSYSWR